MKYNTYSSNKFINVFTEEFDKNNVPIFTNDDCMYVTRLGKKYNFKYLGDNKYIINDDGNIYNLNSLSGSPTTKDIIVNNQNNAYYVICYFDNLTDTMIGIMCVTDDFNKAYNYYCNDIKNNNDDIKDLPVFKEFIYQKLYKYQI